MQGAYMKLLCVAGTRPNFVKISSIVNAARRRDDVEVYVVHTGQHYDAKMSREIFEELRLPEPDINLGVGSGSHGSQLGKVMEGFEKVLESYTPDAILVVGDVNSTLACSIVASRSHIPLIHVEAGLRSGDRDMPEETNRLMTDAIADFLFVTEESGLENLKAEGTPDERVFNVGNTMVDTLLTHLEMAGKLELSEKYRLPEGDYGVLTLHRPSNVDSKETMQALGGAIHQIADRIPLVFPVHPRTKNRLAEHDLLSWFTGHPNIYSLTPLSYLEFLSLQSKARLLLTDSGGIQEEATVLKVPCITIRENTERPSTINAGANFLAGTDPKVIVKEATRILDGKTRDIEVPKLWDGKAGDRILQTLVEVLPKIGRR